MLSVENDWEIDPSIAGEVEEAIVEAEATYWRAIHAAFKAMQNGNYGHEVNKAFKEHLGRYPLCNDLLLTEFL